MRVVDAATGQTRWPTDTTQGYPVSVTMSFAQSGVKTDEPTLREHLARDLADRVARLFHPWQSEQVDSGSPLQ